MQKDQHLMMSCVICLAVLATAAVYAQPGEPAMAAIDVAAFLPEGFVTDGSISYQASLQNALDAVPGNGGIVVFPSMTYRLDDTAGLTVRSNMTLRMQGARFVFAENLESDGQAFLGRDVANVQFEGGAVIGRRGQWAGSTNIAGIRIFGRAHNVTIAGMRFEDLSSNGVGIFGESFEAMATLVRIRDVTTRNCCNFYGDYLSAQKGPAEGSDREDQGNIALYFVDDWVVDGCTLEGSQSDGTHFYGSRNGRFTNNRVCTSQMGGYFLEDCAQVLASGNLISRNGSRGITIERNSVFCTLENNVVEFSGREGLWAPDIMACLVSGNIFRENGRKDDGERDSEIRIDNGDDYETQTRDIRIVNNLFYASPHQHSAVRITADVNHVTVRVNSFRGKTEHGAVLCDEGRCTGIVADANDVDETAEAPPDR